MIKQTIIQENANIYLQKMQKKLMEDQKKIKQLQNKIDKSARIIQRKYRRYIFYKKVSAARKIQKFWKKIMKKIIQSRQKISKFRYFFCSYKIFYFFKAVKNQNLPKKHKSKQAKLEGKANIIYKSLQKTIIEKILLNFPKYMVLMSALQSQFAYLKKYAVYDRKRFTQQWQDHEKKQRQWMWAQIKKRWIKKQGNIWINDSHKQVNAEKYVNTIIQQTYEKEYERLELSQSRIQRQALNIKNKIEALKYSYYLSLLKKS